MAPDVLPLHATTTFHLSMAAEAQTLVPRANNFDPALVFKSHTLRQVQSNTGSQGQEMEMYTYVRPSLRPAGHFRALDFEYDYEHMAKEAAVARARQRQSYQDALVKAATTSSAEVLKRVVDVIGEVMRVREIARLKREAEEKARRELEEFERKCVELVVVRVIQACNVPVDERSEKTGPAPYIWICTAPASKKRGTRKATAPPSQKRGGFIGFLQKAADALGVGGEKQQETLLTDAFTEVGAGVSHMWDEEFALQVDKVGDRTLRLEAVDDRLQFGKDNLGRTRIPIESLALGPPMRNARRYAKQSGCTQR